MFQRLDKMRKQAFGSVCVFGENNNSSISGIFVWRGQGLAFEVSVLNLSLPISVDLNYLFPNSVKTL